MCSWFHTASHPLSLLSSSVYLCSPLSQRQMYSIPLALLNLIIVSISEAAYDMILRSLMEIPGLWLLSISLSGARQRSQGSLSLPIGLRAGIVASNFILRTGGFLSYQATFPLWVAGVRPFKPFSGVVGLAFSLVLVAILYPKKSLHKEIGNSLIGE